MSILTDYHLHSDFSGDSQTPMEQMIERGLALGLQTMCFTEHMDKNVEEGDLDFEVDMEAYSQGFARLKEKYRGKIELLFGVELGVETRYRAFLEEFSAAYPFDFIIGSSHIVDGQDPYWPAYFQGRTEEASYRRYFESIQENLAVFSNMDVYGHLDYIVRYGPHKNQYFSYARYQDLIEPILKTMIEKGIGLEVNSGGYKSGLGLPNPCPDIIRAYRALGGEIVTVGSDAHAPQQIAANFEQVKEILLDCGFRYYAVFRARKPSFLRIA